MGGEKKKRKKRESEIGAQR